MLITSTKPCLPGGAFGLPEGICTPGLDDELISKVGFGIAGVKFPPGTAVRLVENTGKWIRYSFDFPKGSAAH